MADLKETHRSDRDKERLRAEDINVSQGLRNVAAVALDLLQDSPEVMDLPQTSTVTGRSFKPPADKPYVATNLSDVMNRLILQNSPWKTHKPTPKEYFETPSIYSGERGDEVQYGEIVFQPALRVGGKVFTGRTHGEAADKLFKSGYRGSYLPEKLEHGFVTDKGRFLTRAEATAMQGGKGKQLHSVDLKKPWRKERPKGSVLKVTVANKPPYN